MVVDGRREGRSGRDPRLYLSRWECMRAVAELKVEGPSATVTYEEPQRPTPARVDDLELDAVRVVEEDGGSRGCRRTSCGGVSIVAPTETSHPCCSSTTAR